jgi:hypothetical protein
VEKGQCKTGLSDLQSFPINPLCERDNYGQLSAFADFRSSTQTRMQYGSSSVQKKGIFKKTSGELP